MIDREDVSRRDFLLATGGAAFVARVLAESPGCMQRGGEVPGQGKPALTVRSINEYIASAQREDEPTQLLLAAEVKRDVLGFLDQRFALSGAQRRALEALADEDKQRISIAIEAALRPGRRLVFRDLSSRTTTPRMTVSISDDGAGHGAPPNGEVVLGWTCPSARSA